MFHFDKFVSNYFHSGNLNIHMRKHTGKKNWTEIIKSLWLYTVQVIKYKFVVLIQVKNHFAAMCAKKRSPIPVA